MIDRRKSITNRGYKGLLPLDGGLGVPPSLLSSPSPARRGGQGVRYLTPNSICCPVKGVSSFTMN